MLILRNIFPTYFLMKIIFIFFKKIDHFLQFFDFIHEIFIAKEFKDFLKIQSFTERRQEVKIDLDMQFEPFLLSFWNLFNFI